MLTNANYPYFVSGQMAFVHLLFNEKWHRAREKWLRSKQIEERDLYIFCGVGNSIGSKVIFHRKKCFTHTEWASRREKNKIRCKFCWSDYECRKVSTVYMWCRWTNEKKKTKIVATTRLNHTKRKNINRKSCKYCEFLFWLLLWNNARLWGAHKIHCCCSGFIYLFFSFLLFVYNQWSVINWCNVDAHT